jgi:type I restriction-modification system DNA methylase subunit
MPLSWNEIRHNAIRFSKDWAGVTREESEKQTFWNEFFAVFGIHRRAVASFEEPVKNVRDQYGFIDLFWPKVVLVEHKSFGKNLGKAESQAMQYVQDLARDEKRRKEIPRYLIVSDFARVALHDLEEETSVTFPLAELHQRIHAFAFIPGYQQHKFEEQDPINIEATEMLGELHDALEAGGYTGHNLERFLVRILFCLFAEDTGLFQREAFRLYLENRTAGDGSDLGPRLAQLFAVLNTPEDKRQKNLDEELQQFPYVNGDLFSEQLGFAEFNRDMRNALLACTRFDWSRISPAIFGSLFQAVMEPKERRQIGGHYTSERDILKVARSLFLDDLRAELDARKADRSTGRAKRLEEFHDRLCHLKFLDPACGCGNFLVITYRELRALELETLKELFGKQKEFTLADVNRLSRVDVDQFYGIEIGEWPARIAEVALWLMDHQMNLQVSEVFGQLYQRLPLQKSPHIHCANALRLDWKQVLPPDQCSYILGNPPFIGKHYQTRAQKSDIAEVMFNFRNTGDVDYVVCWFKRAAEYIRETRIKVGFVATNSITQGEQVPLIWGDLLDRYNLTIHFAHRTFAWESEARGKAHVHVVIIGFAAHADGAKKLYEYAADGSATQTEVAYINPYLLPGALALVRKRQNPLASVPQMRCGNKPSDGGHLILDDDEKKALLAECPGAREFLRRFVGSDELINGIDRWCLWLDGTNPEAWRALPSIKRRVESVRDFRLKSTALPTKKAAERPAAFFYQSQPATSYVAVPEVSSENRTYIPIAFLPPDVIASNKLYIIESKDVYLFGVLSSAMHMSWVRVVAGRLESRFQYSGTMVYNTFPWPESASEEQQARVRAAAEEVLKQRIECGDGRLGFLPKANEQGWRCSLADLYDPLAMPKPLVKAHAELDRVVDRCYRKEPFTSERQRVEFLFALYEKLTTPLVAAAKPRRARKARGLYSQPPSPAPSSTPAAGQSPADSKAAAAHFHFFCAKDAPSDAEK